MIVPEGLNKISEVDVSGSLSSDGLSDRRETATILFLAYRHYVKAIALRFAPMPQIADEAV